MIYMMHITLRLYFPINVLGLSSIKLGICLSPISTTSWKWLMKSNTHPLNTFSISLFLMSFSVNNTTSSISI